MNSLGRVVRQPASQPSYILLAALSTTPVPDVVVPNISIPSIILVRLSPPIDLTSTSNKKKNGRRRRRGGRDGAGAGDLRRRQHLLQARRVRRHGHEGPRCVPLPLRLRRPRAARVLRREGAADKVDVESCGAGFHLRPHRGLSGAEPVHLRHEADLRHVRLRHDQPHPGHHLRPRRRLPLRGARRPHLIRPGQGRRHVFWGRRRHAARLLQGRGHHALEQPRQPRGGARGSATRVAPDDGGGEQQQPGAGFSARHGQLLLLRAVADPAGAAQPGVPVPLLEHGAHVRHEHGAVGGVRALLRQGRGAVAPGFLRHQAAVRGVLGGAGVGRHAGGAVVVRQAAGPPLRVRVQPADTGGGRRAQLPPPRREAARRQRARSSAHRHGLIRRAMGQTTRGRHRGSQGRERPSCPGPGGGGGGEETGDEMLIDASTLLFLL